MQVTKPSRRIAFMILMSLGILEYTNAQITTAAQYPAYAYLSCQNSNNIDVFGISESGQLSNIPQDLAQPKNGGVNLANIMVFNSNSGKRFLYVLGLTDSTVNIFEINQQNGALRFIDSLYIPLVILESFGAVGSEQYMYIAGSGNDKILMLNIDNNTGLLSICKTDRYPDGLVRNTGFQIDTMLVDNTHHELYAASRGDNTISVYDFSDNSCDLIPRKAATVNTGGIKSSTMRIANSKYLYVISKDSSDITGFSINQDGSLKYINKIRTGVLPQNIALGPNSNYIYATSQLENKNYLYSIDSGGLLNSLSSGTVPNHGVGSAKSYLYNGHYYVINRQSNTIDTFAANSENGTLTFESSIPVDPRCNNPYYMDFM